MLKLTSASHAERSLSYLPEGLRREIIRLCSSRREGVGELREIRVRREGRCSVIYGHRALPLITRVSAEEMESMLTRLCDGSLYAHRSCLSEGYIPVGDGIRVGVCGSARYDGGDIALGDVSSMVFRIPGHRCEFEQELVAVWESGVSVGMLIYSPPGVGKTTALRTLAGRIGSGRSPKRVAVIDERREFVERDYDGCEVDILKGYRKGEGIEIATRTVSPEVIMLDEIGASDAAAVLGALRCGVPVIATAHASSLEELYSRSPLSPLLGCGAFDVFVGILRVGGCYSLTVDRK